MPEIINGFFTPEQCQLFVAWINECIETNFRFARFVMGPSRNIDHIYTHNVPGFGSSNHLDRLGVHRRIFHRPGYITRDVMWNHYTDHQHELHFHHDHMWDEFTVVNLNDRGGLVMLKHPTMREPMDGDPVIWLTEAERDGWPRIDVPNTVGTAVRWTRDEELAGWYHGGVMQPGRMSLVIRHTVRSSANRSDGLEVRTMA